MRKLLNTLYVTRENAYLSLDGENVVLSENGKELVRLPFTNIENIVCMNYIGCSPAVMGKCASTMTGLSFISTNGRLLARVIGPVKGNVLLRKQQLELDDASKLLLTQNLISTKLKNTKNLIQRSKRDYPQIDENGKISNCVEILNNNLFKLSTETDIEILRGIEGQSAKSYFYIFDELLTKQREDFKLSSRSKRPPLDPINAMLSFLYTVCTNDIASALECVGLDPYIGFYHTLRPGRVSLACDIMEEFRCLVERLVISLINLKVIQIDDFEKQTSGAVLLNDEGRKKVITAWQNKKREVIIHPYIKEKVAIGLFPYVQANLLAKYIRGEIESYPNLIWR